MSLAIFLVLILLATFIGVPSEPKADPSDTSYIPRPEWYFLFLFKFLALYGQIPLLGKIEWIATVIIPSIAIGLLVLLPFIDKRPRPLLRQTHLADFHHGHHGGQHGHADLDVRCSHRLNPGWHPANHRRVGHSLGHCALYGLFWLTASR